MNASEAHDAAGYRSFRQCGWRGKIHRDFALPTGVDALEFLCDESRVIHRQRQTATTWRLRRGGLDVYVKHMTGVKDTTRPSLVDRAKWELRPSRAGWVLRTSLAMKRRGFHAPPVLLAAQRRGGGTGSHDLLVTQTVEGRTLGQRILTLDAAARRDDLTRIGGHIAAMHLAGIYHGDLLPGNILMTETGEVVLLDNDRTVCLPIALPWRHRRRNLSQMVFRFVGAIPHPDGQRFLDAYFERLAVAESTRRRESARIWRRVRRRFDRTHGVGPGSRAQLLQQARNRRTQSRVEVAS